MKKFIGFVSAKQWREKGRFIEVNGHQHFVYDSRNNKPPLLILHGYPTSTYDYHKSLEFLETKYRVIMHDHLGFGYSAKPLKHSYSLMEQADQTLMLWQQLGLNKGLVLAHDYGTSIATELLARDLRFNQFDFQIEQMVLCNGSMHVELAQLRLIQKLLMNKWTGPWVAKLSNKATLARSLKHIYFDPKQLSKNEIDAIWEMMVHNQGRKVLPQLTQYIKQRYTYWHRWIGALQQTAVPIHIVWAKEDPVAVIEMAEILHQEIKHSKLTLLDQLGHFPMLENPEVWSKAVLKSLSDKLV